MYRFSTSLYVLAGAAAALTAASPAAAATMITTVYYGNSSNVVDWFRVAQTGTYIVTAAGGAGGGARGGAGAIMTAQFEFNAGDSYVMSIGGAGASYGNRGDGGSGTFFATNDARHTPILVAGGGGGSGIASNWPQIENTYGGNANFTSSGSKGGGSLDGYWQGKLGGFTGSGGSSTDDPGSGGGGFRTGSEGLQEPQDYGASFLEVLASEQDSRTGLPTKVNGGASLSRAGGGGGGYSGGGAGNDRRQPRAGSDADYGGGGGGGSFIASSGTLLATNYNQGTGWLRIEFISTSLPPIVVDPPAVPEPSTWAMMIGGFGLVGGAMRRRVRRADTKLI